MMFKIFLLCAVAFSFSACQQKPGSRPEPENLANTKVDPNSALAKTKLISTCNGKYTRKVHNEDGSTELQNIETITQFENSLTLIKEEAGYKTSQVAGGFYTEENLIAADGSKKLELKTDYTFTGNIIRKTIEISNNTYETNSVREYVKTGRNGYKLRNKEKELVDTVETKTTEKMVYFDDGQMMYTVAHEFNGKDIMPYNLDLLTQYTETKVGNKITTNSKITLRNPTVFKDSKGQITEEVTEYEENCTEEQVVLK